MQIADNSLSTSIPKACLTDGFIDLGQTQYRVTQFQLAQSTLAYTNKNEIVSSGFDPSHIVFQNINIQLDSLLYKGK